MAVGIRFLGIQGLGTQQDILAACSLKALGVGI